MPMPTDYELIRETLIEHCHELLEGAEAIAALDRLKASMDACSKAASDNAALAERRRVEMFRYRVALEQLVQGINQNLGTHDHTDWELARMVERAEAVLNEE